MTISVKNSTRRPKTIQVLGGGTDTVRFRKTTKAKTRFVDLQVLQSVTIGAGEVLTGLPDACADEARARGLDVFVETGAGK